MAFTIKVHIVKTLSHSTFPLIWNGKKFCSFVNAVNTDKWASEKNLWLQNWQKTTPKWPPNHARRMENGPLDSLPNRGHSEPQ